MRNSPKASRHLALCAGTLALALGGAAMPDAANAAQAPGTCDLINNTMCAPVPSLGKLLSWLPLYFPYTGG